MVWIEVVVTMTTAVVTLISAALTAQRGRRVRDLNDRVRLEKAGGPWDPERRAALKAAWLELEQQFGPEMTPTPSWVHGEPKPWPKPPLRVPISPAAPPPVDRAKLQRDLDRLKAEADTLKTLKAMNHHPGLAAQIEALTSQWRQASERLGAELEAAFRVPNDIISMSVGDVSYTSIETIGGGIVTVPRRLNETEIDALKRCWGEKAAAGKVTLAAENLAMVRDAERKAMQAACVHDTVVYREGDLPSECRCAKCHRRFSRHG